MSIKETRLFPAGKISHSGKNDGFLPHTATFCPVHRNYKLNLEDADDG